MNSLTVNDLENFAFSNQGTKKNNNYQMENLTPAEANLITANLAFTEFFLDSDLEGYQFSFTVSNPATAAKSIWIFKGKNTNFTGGLTLTDGAMGANTGGLDSDHLVNGVSGTPGTTIAEVLWYLTTKKC
jgi:hypothetical protein